MKAVFKKRGIIIGLVVVVLLIIAVIGIVVAHNHGQKDNTYQTMTIKKDAALLLKGQIAADNTVDVMSPDSTSTLQTINVQDGEHVAQGETLMTFYDASVESQIEEAQQTVAKTQLAVQQDQQSVTLAQNTATSTTDAEGNTTSTTDQSAISQAQSQLAQDQLALSQAQQQISSLEAKLNPTVKAAISGTIALNYNTQSTTGLPSMQIISDGQIINGTVSEYDYAKIKERDHVTVLPISSDDKLSGTIINIAATPQDSGTSATSLTASSAASSAGSVSYYKFTVRVARKLVNGFNVQIKVPQDTIRVPEKAIVQSDKKHYVFRVVNHKAIKTQVHVHQDNGIWYLDSGLQTKDKIIVNPDKSMKTGQEVSTRAD